MPVKDPPEVLLPHESQKESIVKKTLTGAIATEPERKRVRAAAQEHIDQEAIPCECIVCGSEDIVYHGPRYDGCGFVEEKCHCQKCQSSWTMTYKLYGIESIYIRGRYDQPSMSAGGPE